MTIYDYSTFAIGGVSEENAAKRRQVIAFLGNGLEFPNHNLEAIAGELPGVDILRLEALAEVSDVSKRVRVDTALLVITEGRRDDLIERFVRYSEAAPNARLVFAYESAANARQVFQSEIGSSVSFLPMRCRIDSWIAYVRLLCSGDTVLPRELLTAEAGETPQPRNHCESKPVHLTRRENDVLALVAEGLGNRQIAASIGISEHTVKLHLHNVFAKLEVSNRAAAVAWYLRNET